MSEIPKISVTKDFDNEISEDERDECDIRDAHTDIEDFDDDIDDRSTGIKFLIATNLRISPGATDIEDYNDSSSDEENFDHIDGGPSVPLVDFLEEGMVEERDAAENKITTITGSKAAGRFTSYLEDDPGCLTDCENLHWSGDEFSIASDVEGDISISAFIPEPENVKISDKMIDEAENLNVSQRTIKDKCQHSDSSLSDSVTEESCHPNELLDTENFSISDTEDDTHYKKACSLRRTGEPISLKPKTLSPCTISYLGIEIADIQEDDLTDVEKLDMDTDEEIMDGSQLYPFPELESHRPSLTDIEDMDVSDAASDYLSDPMQVNLASIPPPIREITIVWANASGQGVASIMPLKDNFEMAISMNSDQELTDNEEISGNEEDFYDTANNLEEIPEIHNAITQNSEVIKVMNIKRNETVTECEPTTDVEEFFLPGTVRRKKIGRSKTQSKGKKLLNIKAEVEQVKTDIEEFEDISDAETGIKTFKVLQLLVSNTGKDSPDMITDVEDYSGVDELSVSEGEEENPTATKVLNETSFYSTVTTMESLFQGRIPHEQPVTRPASRHPLELSTANNPNLTDTEDIPLTSDVEEENPIHATFQSRTDDTASPYVLQDVLNDCSVSTVHEKCLNTFNIDKEKQHIKDYRDCSDVYTDIEYFDDENDVGKEKKST